jgi:superfamily I DNA/RNA helicase
MEKKINNSRIYTYEEFILKEICLYIGINTSKYILYRESQEILEKLKSNKMDRTFQKIFEDVNMPMNELTRFVHAFCYTQANESNIQEYISKKLDRSGIVSYDRERLAMIKILQEYQRALDVKKKIRWYLLFEEIIEKRPMLKDKSFPAILLDEMQDLDQTEFNMLKEIFKICKKDDFLFKVAYDPNQNIEVHGSGSKNIENRLKEIDKSQKYELRYNYRNSQNIKIFSSYFINAGTELYDEFMHGNESFVQVKLTVCSDKQALEQLRKFVEKKNINLPILAYGDLCPELKKMLKVKKKD